MNSHTRTANTLRATFLYLLTQKVTASASALPDILLELKAKDNVTASGRPSGTATASTVIAVMMYVTTSRPSTSRSTGEGGGCND